MTLLEIAEKINKLAYDGKHKISKMQQLRKEEYGYTRLNKQIFSSKSVVEDEGYAFHSGGMEELQFNIGNKAATGIEKFRYGVAFSFQSTRHAQDPIDTLRPVIKRFNNFIEQNPTFFNGYEMWLWDGGENYKYNSNVVKIKDDLIKPGNFIFIGKFIDKPQNKINDIDINNIIDTFDYLFTVYAKVQFGKEPEDKTKTEDIDEEAVLKRMPELLKTPQFKEMFNVYLDAIPSAKKWKISHYSISIVSVGNKPYAFKVEILGFCEGADEHRFHIEADFVIDSASWDGVKYANWSGAAPDHMKVYPYSQDDSGAAGDKTVISREAKEPCLNAKEYARALTNIFSSTKEDFSFALFGKWGRGKTYQMKLVAEKLKKGHNYEIINFSAWKYRTNPSLWVHLYENFVDKIKKQGIVSRFFVYFRTGINKTGIWPWKLIGISIILLLIYMHLNIKFSIWKFVGIMGAISFGGIWSLCNTFNSIRKISPRCLEKFGLLPAFKEKLGLQETTGTNLKHLIKGWTDSNFKKSNYIIPVILFNLFICLIVLTTVKYFPGTYSKSIHLPVFSLNRFFVSIFTFSLLSIIEYIFLLKNIKKRETGKSIPTFFIFIDTCCTGIFDILFIPLSLDILPFLEYTKEKIQKYFDTLLFFEYTPKKILLIVDDLDRCEMSEMLCVIESIILLLDEDDLKKKLQIAMLVENEAIRLAIGHKYIEMIRSRNYKHEEGKDEKTPLPYKLDDQLFSKMGSEVINENIEKLFLCTLKLGKLNNDEKRDTMFSFLKENSDDLENFNRNNQAIINEITDDKTGALTDDKGSILTDDKGSALTYEKKTKNNENVEKNIKTETEITQSECDRLMRIIFDWGVDTEDKWGPRALRALKFKYVFARLLLKEFGIIVEPELLCKVLENELKINAEEQRKSGGKVDRIILEKHEEIYRQIVKQVI